MSTILFFDDWPMHLCRNLDRKMGRPTWVADATLADDLVEGTWNFPLVFHDSAAGLWRALYAGVSYRASDTGAARQFLGLLYAESPDGIHWTKPDVAARSQVTKRRRSNQVFSFDDGHSDGGPTFLDPVEQDPRRRLKYLFSTRDANRQEGRQRLATSPDGLSWTVENAYWGQGLLDAPITAFYNHRRDTYVIVRRPAQADRRVALAETRDFREVAAPRVILHPDPLDPPLLQFYGMPVYRYEDVYVGLLQCLHVDPDEGGFHKRGGYVDGQLTYSYDGQTFNRTFREPFVPRNERGQPGGGGIYPSTLLVDDQHQIRIYSGGSPAAHFQSTEVPDSALLLHTLRLDGFLYLAATAGTGYLMTRRLLITGPDLRLNVRAPYGQVRVQLSEPDGTPISGFTFDECYPFAGDDLFYRPTWRGSANVAALIGRLLHVEVELAHGDIYSIRGDCELVVGFP